MDVEIVRDADGLDDLRAEWEELEGADSEVPFYSTFAVVRGWWAAYGQAWLAAASRAVLDRDYAVVFATLYIFSLFGLLLGLISDLTYMWIDPRIDFESRDV